MLARVVIVTNAAEKKKLDSLPRREAAFIEPMECARFDGRLVKYDFGELDEVALSYAVTIHKVGIASSRNPARHPALHLLQRNLIYTGITRGKKLVVVIGRKRRWESPSVMTARRGDTRGSLLV